MAGGAVIIVKVEVFLQEGRYVNPCEGEGATIAEAVTNALEDERTEDADGFDIGQVVVDGVVHSLKAVDAKLVGWDRFDDVSGMAALVREYQATKKLFKEAQACTDDL